MLVTRFGPGSCAIALFLATSATAAPAQSVRVNGPLVQPGAGDVLGDFAFSPSGARLVFRADAVADGEFELYSAPADAIAPALRLAPLVEVTSFVLGFGRAVYVGGGPQELFMVPLTGGTPLLLSGALVAGGNVTSVQLTPDRTRAVFIADKVVDGRFELFSVPIDGSAAPVRLDPANVPGPGAVNEAWITPDGETVLFTHAPGFHMDERLFAVPIDGSAPVQLLATVPVFDAYADFGQVRFTPDGEVAAFNGLEMFDGSAEAAHLYSTRVDGTGPQLTLESNFLDYPHFLVGAGGRVLFRPGNDLVSCAADGTQRVRHDPVNTTPDAHALSPDGTTVVFSAYVGNQTSLYRAPLDGSQPATFLFGPSSTVFGAIAFADAQHVVFNTGSPVSLRALDLADASSVELSGQGSDYVQPASVFAATPDGNVVIFSGWRQFAVTELFSAPIDGSAPPHLISAALGDSRDVSSFRIGAVGHRVAYLSDQRNESTNEVFATSPLAAEPVSYLELPGGPVVGDVRRFAVAPDERGVVYGADQYEDEVVSLFGGSARGSTPSTLLKSAFFVDDLALSAAGTWAVFKSSGSLVSTRRIGTLETFGIDSIVGPQYAIAPDETRVAYQHGSTANYELRTAPIDSSLAGVRVSGFIGSGRSVTGFEIGSDSQRVAYRSDEGVNDVFELYSAPLDASAPRVKLNQPLAGSSRDVGDFGFGPDASLVAFIADPDVVNEEELFLVPADGSALPVQLNATLALNGDVTGFAFTPDGARVVYRADQVADGRFELFSVDVLAPVPVAVPLTPLAGTLSVQSDFDVVPGSARVLYRADANVAGVQELFVVPVDGSAAPVQLSGPLVAAGDVVSFVVAPDGQRVVYLADQNADEVFEVFSVPAVGGPVVALDALPAFADVDLVRVAPDSLSVVWRADRNADGVLELFGAPLDGSAPAARLNDPLPSGGNVEADFVALSGGRALYRADQEADEVFELFFARLGARGNGAVLQGPRGPLPKPPPIVR